MRFDSFRLPPRLLLGTLLSDPIDWPIEIREIRLGLGSIHSGRRLRRIPLRLETGASILAVSRAPERHSSILSRTSACIPRMGMVAAGRGRSLKRAAEYLERKDLVEDREAAEMFTLAELGLSPDSRCSGKRRPIRASGHGSESV